MSTKTPSEAALKRLTRQIDETFEEVARLSGMNLPPTEFYQQFLAKVLAGIEAPAGAVWLRTPQGFLQLQCQTNLDKIGLDVHKGARQHHNELLRYAFQNKKELLVEPGQKVRVGEAEVENKTEHVVILAPIKTNDDRAVGIVEVCPEIGWDTRIHPIYLNYVIQMSGYASNYVLQTSSRQAVNQEQVWAQLESFSRSIHSSLNPTEVAYQIANDGRKLIGCDRLSVAVRHGPKAKVEAVSGSDVVEKASVHVRAMRRLFDAVIRWNEKLVFRGTKDETLPPQVLEALDDYLAESHPKLLVVQPLHDEREKEDQKPRSALLMESFEPPELVEPMVRRLEVIGNHAASALYNAAEMKRVPFRWVWAPIVKIQDGLGGKTRFWLLFSLLLLVGLTLAMVFVPYPLRLDANGELVPVERAYIFPTRAGQIKEFLVNPKDTVQPGTPLVRMFDPELAQKIEALRAQRESAQSAADLIRSQLAQAGHSPAERARMETDRTSKLNEVRTLTRQISELEKIHRADPNRPGHFYLVAPDFPPNRPRGAWTVLSADYRETLTGRSVTPAEPVLRLGYKDGPWEIELKIPQKHIGQVLKAYRTSSPTDFLEVDVLVTSVPTHTYKGRLYRNRIGGEAVPNKTDQNETEPVVYAYVVVNEPDMRPEEKIPGELLVTGVGVHTKVRCGDHAMGYSLFYGLYEFLYRNVIFFF